MRPQLVARTARALGRRANSSKAIENPQVKQAVEQADAVLKQGTAAVKKVVGPIGDRVGSLLGSYRQPLSYNWNVFTSLCRQVYQAEKLAPPTHIAQWANAYASIFAKASSGAFWRQALSSGQWATIAVAGVEAYGIFKIGEILGRRNLVGYKIKDEHHH